jgi:hypothetical protein
VHARATNARVLFDQQHGTAKLGGLDRRTLPYRPATNDYEIVLIHAKTYLQNYLQSGCDD